MMTKLINMDKKIKERISYHRERYDYINIYKTNTLDKDNGINYKDFVKVRSEAILNNTISLIGTEAWLILYYLMVNAIRKEYIKTSIKFIEFDLNIKNADKWLNLLKCHGLIHINNLENKTKAKIGKNDILEILVNYSNDELYKVRNKAYKALPTQYVRYLISQLRLTHEEFAVYTVLVNYFRWFECKRNIDEYTGEIKYYYLQCEYAFPTQKQIANKIGISRTRVLDIINSLAKKGVISYEPNYVNKTTKVDKDKGKNVIVNPNYRYKVYLLQRVEYVYFNYIDILDKRSKKVKMDIKNKGFEKIAYSDEQDILRDRDYLNYRYGDKIIYFEKAIKEKQDNYYLNEDGLVGEIKEFKNITVEQFAKKEKRKKEKDEKYKTERKEIIDIRNKKEYNGHDKYAMPF